MTGRRWMPPTLWAAVILVLTSIPSPAIGVAAPRGADKAVHFLLYAVLGVLAGRAALAGGGRTRTLLAALAAILVFAALDEWHQAFIPGRSSDRYDWLADAIGAAGGGFLAAGSLRKERTS